MDQRANGAGCRAWQRQEEKDLPTSCTKSTGQLRTRTVVCLTKHLKVWSSLISIWQCASLLQWNLHFHSFLSPKVSCWQKRNHFLKHIGQINVIIDVLMDFSYFADTLTTTFSIKYQYTFNCLLLSLKINIRASEVKCSLHNMFLTWLRTRPPFKAASESGHVSGCVHTSWCPTSPSSSCSRRRPSHRSENKSSTGGFPVWNTGNATISIQWALIHLQCELKIKH